MPFHDAPVVGHLAKPNLVLGMYDRQALGLLRDPTTQEGWTTIGHETSLADIPDPKPQRGGGY